MWGEGEREDSKTKKESGNLSDWDEKESPQKKRKVARKAQEEEDFDYDWDEEDDDEIVSPPKKARKVPPKSKRA